MLTKEECVKCLNDLYLASSRARLFITDRDYCHDVLMKLIEEHFYLLEKYKILQDENGRLTFNNIANNINDMNYKLWLDNPPLKLEELKKGMWIWDNKYKDYIHLRDNCSLRGPLYWSCEIVGEGYVHTFEYEENRFYRKQVVE